MNVSAVLVTRGNVDLQPVIDSLPPSWEIVIWDNGERMISRGDGWAEVCQDLSVYGRYAAIEYTSHDLVYVQDDDCIVSGPQAIVDAWQRETNEWYRTEHLYTEGTKPPLPVVVCNMPQHFRHEGYTDSALVGFGACFHRLLPDDAFQRFAKGSYEAAATLAGSRGTDEQAWWRRTCDVVFTTLTSRILVDVPYKDREFASDPDRMWRQPDHVGERARMLALAREARGS